jgi:hypothetical protein
MSNNMKKTLSILFYLLFVISLIYTTFFHVPKYGYDKTSRRTPTTFYNINTTLGYIENTYPCLYANLQIDYGEWLIITFTECAIFLTPAIFLYKSSKKEVK